MKGTIRKKKELINNYDQDQRLIPVHLDFRIKQGMKLPELLRRLKVKEDLNQNSSMLKEWCNQINLG